ncbi:MAG: nitroreductase family protein [Actinomycetota bacterium]
MTLDETPTPTDMVGLLEGIATTRSIRRYLDEPVPDSVLRDVCFAASRAPSGSNRQLFRMIVLTDGPVATQAKALVAEGAQTLWAAKRRNDGYEDGSGAADDSPKARMARSMDAYVDGLASVPALIFPTLIRHREPTPTEGASVYPAMQNLLLAARGLGYGGVVTMWHATVEPQLRALLEMPDDVLLAATVTLGKPVGGHGPVRRRPLDHFVYDGVWGQTPEWAVDPPGTRHTSAGPPTSA